MVTIDHGDLVRNVIKSWFEDYLNVDHLMYGNWVVLSRHDAVEVYSPEVHRRAETNRTCEIHKGYCASLKFETKILRSDIFAQVNLMSVAPTLQNLRIGL